MYCLPQLLTVYCFNTQGFILIKKLLIIAFVWPEPNSTAAGERMSQLIHFFLEQDYQITIASAAAESEHSMNFDAIGIQKECIELNHSSFDEFVSELNPEIVLFDRFLTEEQFGWRVAEFAPNALRILDTEDLHSLRQTREKALKNSIPFSTDLWLQNENTKREISSIYRSDISLIISSYEMYLLKDFIKMDDSILLLLPFMLNPLSEATVKSWNNFEDRNDFICIGNGKHAPNADAVRWLKKEIWPLIRKELPKANLNIYGAYLPEQIKQMHKPSEGFLVHGWVKNKEEVFQNAKINLAPLRFGAGLKGKLIDAMQNGTPSITTSVGAEGMHGNLDWSGEVADSAADIAEEAIQLYTQKELWFSAQKNGVQIVNQLYAKEKWIPQFINKLNSVQNNLKKHRSKNFIGAMLQQQTTASSKYLSKWIEEKNKKN